ncbi:MAG: DUF1295 domain-containing protein [Sphingobacteriales bacterium]|nr:DUF1295 domain-containing protein [Sphingobacteriales bacterium]
MHITLEQYNLFTWLWMGLGVSIFILLLFITAPYGRHTKTTWGPLINNKLGWFIMEITLIGVLAFFVCIGHNKQSLVNWIIVGLITFHYLNRSLLFPLRIRTGYKKCQVLIMFMGVFFNIINGFLFGYYLAYFKVYPTNWMMSPQFIIGAIIFIAGTVINWKSDNVLIHLRKPGELGYKIPQGGWFRYISCPNLFGEVIEWMGFALLTWSLPGLAFFVWTFANLVPRAVAHHQWYHKQFANYPPYRKAIFPFLW